MEAPPWPIQPRWPPIRLIGGPSERVQVLPILAHSNLIFRSPNPCMSDFPKSRAPTPSFDTVGPWHVGIPVVAASAQRMSGA
jgi:hypothetical protein